MKIQGVLTVITVACISVASGASVTEPVTISPTSTIPETRPPSTWTSEEIQAIDSEITRIDGRLPEFNKFFGLTRDEEVKKWSKRLNLGSASYDGAQWMNYYLLINALDAGLFDFAVKIVDELYVPGTPVESVSSEIRELMRGGPNSDYEGILMRLMDAEKRKTPANERLFSSLQSKLTILVYGVDYNSFRGNSVSDLLASTVLTNENNVVKYYAGLMRATKEQIQAIISGIVAYNNVELGNVALSGLGADAKSLVPDNIFQSVKSEMMTKLLLKFHIPVFSAKNVKHYQVYGLTDELVRFKVLNLLKYKNVAGNADKALHDGIFQSDPGVTMREALIGKNGPRVQAFFGRPEYTRNMYDSKWIIFAIKFSNLGCLELLLQERVPLPTEAELNAAYSLQNEADTRALVDSYKPKYAAFNAALGVQESAPRPIYDATIPAVPAEPITDPATASNSTPTPALPDVTDIRFPEVERIGEAERGIYQRLVNALRSRN